MSLILSLGIKLDIPVGQSRISFVSSAQSVMRGRTCTLLISDPSTWQGTAYVPY